jgi:hypothetical protein
MAGWPLIPWTKGTAAYREITPGATHETALGPLGLINRGGARVLYVTR